MNCPGPRVDVEGVLRHSTVGIVSPWAGVSGCGGGRGCWYPGFWQKEGSPIQGELSEGLVGQAGNPNPAWAPQCPAAQPEKLSRPSAHCQHTLQRQECPPPGPGPQDNGLLGRGCLLIDSCPNGLTALRQRGSSAPCLPHRKGRWLGPSRGHPPGAQALGTLLARPGSSCCLQFQEGRVRTWAGTPGGTTGLTQASAVGEGVGTREAPIFKRV